MNAQTGRRLLGVVSLLACVWAVLVVRLFIVQVVQHRAYWARAQARQTHREELRPVRGRIVDRAGHALAEDIETSELVVCVAQVAPDPRAIGLIASALQWTEAETREKLARSKGYVRLSRSLSLEAERLLRDEKCPGVSFPRTSTRVNPRHGLAAALLGRTDADGRGQEGLELALDSDLRGTPGWATMVRDGHGAVYPDLTRTIREPVDGTCIDLTIDAEFQAIAEDELTRGIAENHAKGGTVVLVDPRTGDILAMASADGDRAPRLRVPRNRAIADQYEPGSTFKVVVAAAAIEEKLVTPATPVFCENGHWVTDDWRLSDSHGHGTLSFCDVIAQSSNIGTAKVGLRLGNDGMYDYARRFGFGRATGIGLPAETGGRLATPARWSARSLPTISIGQEVAVTPLQVAMAYAALANDGVLMAPRLVRSLRRTDGRLVRATEPRAVRRVVSAETARTVRTFLAATVDSGTAKAARIGFARVGGKTGTAQKYDPALGGYSPDRYIASFVGMLPVENPSLVCLVVIDEPVGGVYYGGLVAAPIWRNIIEAIGRVPHAPIRPDFRRVAPDKEAWAAVPGAPAFAAPAPDPSLAGDSSYTGPIAPNLVGSPLRDALRVLRARDLRFAIDGTGVVTQQSPAPGAPVRDGDIVRLVCRAVFQPAHTPSFAAAPQAAGAVRAGAVRD